MRIAKLSIAVLAVGLGPWATGQNVHPDYAGSYSLLNLGNVPNVPFNYGGLTLKRGTTDRLLIGGAANQIGGGMYEIGVTRDGQGHINGFVGTATYVANLEYNDGGLTYHNGSGVLFASRWPVNALGQYKPGSFNPDKIIDLAGLNVAQSHAALQFVPSNFPAAAGRLKLSSWAGGEFYDCALIPDGLGTFDITVPQLRTTLGGGPEGIIYVPPGSPLFGSRDMLVSEYSAGMVAHYECDANGDPDVLSRRTFVEGLFGAEGAFVDPLTGDFLFSTFGSGNEVFVVRGFASQRLISGDVDLQDFFGDPQSIQATLEIRNVGSTTPIESHTIALFASSGYSVVTSVSPGTYDIAIKPNHWLRHKRGSIAVGTTGATVDFSVANGDVDEDNEITIGDYAQLSAAFGSVPGDGNWNALADLEGDLEVTIGDYAILSQNFGMLGDD